MSIENVRKNIFYQLMKRFVFILLFFVYPKKSRIHYYAKWVKDDGENNLLVNYPLNKKSLVVDVGGYTGHFSDRIIELYDPHLIILEPVEKYYKILKNKYINNKKVEIYNYGLSNKNYRQKIYLSNDGTSIIKKSNKTETIKLIDSATFLRKFKSVDLLSVNIEGSEYDVLERLIETSSIKKIKFLQIQFHSFVPRANNRRRNIIKNILKTHRVYFSYPFVWESFKSKY